MYIYFLAHVTMIIQKKMRISKLQRRGPGGDHVLCMSMDLFTRRVYYDWLVLECLW